MVYVFAVLMILCGTISAGTGLFAFAGGSHILAALALAFGILAVLCGHAVFA